MYEVQFWNKYEYPSHWAHEKDFDNLEDAISYCESQMSPSDYRVIEIHWQKD